MHFEEYDSGAAETDHGMPTLGQIGYLAFALNGEAGELANEVKKHYRDDVAGRTVVEGAPYRGSESVDASRRDRILLECGDVLWYMSRLAAALGSSVEEIAAMNLTKLARRHGHPKPRLEGVTEPHP